LVLGADPDGALRRSNAEVASEPGFSRCRRPLNRCCHVWRDCRSRGAAPHGQIARRRAGRTPELPETCCRSRPERRHELQSAQLLGWTCVSLFSAVTGSTAACRRLPSESFYLPHPTVPVRWQIRSVLPAVEDALARAQRLVDTPNGWPRDRGSRPVAEFGSPCDVHPLPGLGAIRPPRSGLSRLHR